MQRYKNCEILSQLLVSCINFTVGSIVNKLRRRKVTNVSRKKYFRIFDIFASAFVSLPTRRPLASLMLNEGFLFLCDKRIFVSFELHFHDSGYRQAESLQTYQADRTHEQSSQGVE